MPVHIFAVDEENFKICTERGLAAIPGLIKDATNDSLLSRMAIIRKGDLLLFYVVGKKELRGVYKTKEKAFFDESKVWPENDKNQIYPYRVPFETSQFTFKNPIYLSDIYDLKDQGLIWTFTLHRPNGTPNALFSITKQEFDQVLKLFLKVNFFYQHPHPIPNPYPYFKPGISHKLTFDDSGKPKYEATLMSLLLDGFVDFRFTEIFGNYDDYVSYVPTSFNKEIDILLIHNNPLRKDEIIGYTIIEVKNGSFDEKALSQILRYEEWFLKKRVNGDHNMIRTVAIAKTFSKKVIDYLQKRKVYEGKSVLLLSADYNNEVLNLQNHCITEDEP